MSQPQGLEHLCLESHGNTVIGSKDLDQPRDCNSSLLPGKIQHSHSCQGSVLVTGLGAVNSVATGLPRNPYACFSNVDSASLPHQASPRQCSPSHRHIYLWQVSCSLVPRPSRTPKRGKRVWVSGRFWERD